MPSKNPGIKKTRNCFLVRNIFMAPPDITWNVPPRDRNAPVPPDISLYAGVFLLYVIFHCIGHKRRNSLRIFYLPCKDLLFKLIYRISFQIDKLIFIQMLL